MAGVARAASDAAPVDKPIIWDTHCHLSGDGRTPEEKLANLIRYAKEVRDGVRLLLTGSGPPPSMRTTDGHGREALAPGREEEYAAFLVAWAKRFEALGASVLGMCVESDRAHTAFAAALEVQFPLVSDFNRQVVRDFGIDYTEDEPFSGFWGMSRRSVFVLDREGVVRYAWVTDDPLVAPDVQEALAAVKKLAAR